MLETKITIYSTPYCGYCKLAKDYFNENNISYQEIDVSQDEKALEQMVAKSKQRGAPVIVVEKDGNEEIMVGFIEEKLKKLINN